MKLRKRGFSNYFRVFDSLRYFGGERGFVGGVSLGTRLLDSERWGVCPVHSGGTQVGFRKKFLNI